jgi:hypothetical protein
MAPGGEQESWPGEGPPPSKRTLWRDTDRVQPLTSVNSRPMGPTGRRLMGTTVS